MSAISFLRLILRAVTAFIWTLFCYFVLVRLPQLLMKNKRYLKSISIWGKGLASIMGIKIHRVNERSGPMGDMIISNHLGFLDVPIMLSVFPGVFAIKEEMKSVFFFGQALVKQGHVFVKRDDNLSKRQALLELMKVLKEDDRIIVFPEGKASPGAERLPFNPGSFLAVKRLDKTVEPCVIDYLPDRSMLAWDVEKKMLPQLVDLFGRRRIDVSIEFFPPQKIEGRPADFAEKWQKIMQDKLEQNDRKRDAAKN
jgi:1-acyl-sn-glycerol-3-phosphate acyltransferase